MVESNKEHGEGRSDVVVYDSIDGRVVIFEAKYSKTIDAMDQDCQAAIKQIDQRMYAKEYEDSCDEVICYGISFYKKRCTIRFLSHIRKPIKSQFSISDNSPSKGTNN